MTHISPRLCALAVLVATMFATSPCSAQDATLDRAKQMIADQKGKGNGAFELLAPLEEQRSGDADFDYLFGLAAIDAGEYTRAVFALERVLAVRPDHPQARAEIARAYFLMGENKTARAEFEAVKAARPPAEVISTIDRFLTALDERQAYLASGAAGQTGITGYIEAGIGYDSNANTASSATGFAIPNFPAFVFSGGSRWDTFTMLNAGISGRYKLSEQWSINGGANLSRRTNTQVDRSDIGFYDANAGVTYLRGDHEYSVTLQQQTLDVDNGRFRDAFGGLAQWKYTASPNQQWVGYAQYTRLVYPNLPGTAPGAGVPAQTDRNARRSVIGAAWAQSFEIKYAPTVYAGVYGGQEQLMSITNTYDEFAHKLYGVRFGGQVALAPKLAAFANVSFEDRHYGYPGAAVNQLLFPFNRVDREWNLRVGINYPFARNWTFTPSVSVTENHSNVVVNAFRRNLFTAMLRYDFR